MKRYRIVSMDFDTRALFLKDPIPDEWEESVKETHRQNKQRIEESLIHTFGGQNYYSKRQNFIDIGTRPFSVIAFHNRFFEQVRRAFVTGCYYPALTGACALGERILNHLVLKLRDDFKSSPEYKRIYKKSSFDRWEIPIDILSSWNILLPDVVEDFHKLRNARNGALHFQPEVDTNDRELALTAIQLLNNIISNQFSAGGKQPWFLTGIPGEIYIRKDHESCPFVRHVYLPNCLYVGHKHEVASVSPQFVVNDNFAYEDREVTDEEFCILRMEWRT